MTIQLNDAGKRFNRDWIFRHVTYVFQEGRSYAITGAIAGSMNMSEGTCEWTVVDRKAEDAETYKYISIVAPYLEVIEEMSVKEFLSFHASFKPLISDISIDEIIRIIGLEKAADKQIRYYSSGMKQRVKLAQAIFSDAPIILLDEPCTNLDKTGYDLYHRLIKNYCSNKLIIVSSNDENEMDFCEERISIMDYK